MTRCTSDSLKFTLLHISINLEGCERTLLSSYKNFFLILKYTLYDGNDGVLPQRKFGMRGGAYKSVVHSLIHILHMRIRVDGW